jgi:WD40 repeat protein
MVFREALHRGFISALTWSPDGQRLASASHDGTIRLSSPLDVRVGVQILSGHRGEVNALAWTKLPPLAGGTANASALFSGGADGTLRAWVPTANSGGAFTVPGQNWISAANWSPDGTRLLVANFRDPFYFSDPVSGQSYPIRPTHGNIFDAAWSPSGDRLATASRGNDRVEMFDAASGASLGIFGLPQAYRVAWSPSGKYLAACGPGGTRVWDSRTGALMVVISRPAGSLVWHPDERRIILGAEDGAIELWDAFSGKMVGTWRTAPAGPTGSVASEHEPPRRIFDLHWSPDLRLLAFVTQDSVAGVLNARDGRLVRTFSGHTSGIWRVVWNADGTRLATAGQDGMVRVFDAKVGGQVAHINHGLGNTELHALDWSRDGRRLVSGGFDRYVRVWNAQRGERLDAVEQLAQKAQTESNNLEVLRELARLYAQLGWADDARRTYERARTLAPEDAALPTAAAGAELSFARLLDAETPDGDPTLTQNVRTITLLTRIYDAWEAEKADAALAAWRELAQLPNRAEALPIARTYLNRARWAATWFSSKVDPLANLEGWRAQASGAGAVLSNVRTLNFPYLHRGPKDLLLTTELTERGPGAGKFGMIARTRVTLPAGKWRFQVKGGDGARVIVNGQAVLENWAADAPPEMSVDYEQGLTGAVDLTVEHFVKDGTDGFQFLIEPLLGE